MRFVWVLLMGAALASAQRHSEDTPKPRSQKKQKAKSGQHEAIQVHGHWVLEIRNPDGSVASRREFENSLVPSGFSNDPGTGWANRGGGQAALAWTLAGGNSVVQWAIFFNYASLESPPAGCVIGADCALAICNNVALGCNGPQFSAGGLTVTVANGGTQLVLQGTTPPSPGNGSFNSVATNILTSPVASSPNSEMSTFSFTSANLNVNIQAGQTVNVTVNLSFM